MHDILGQGGNASPVPDRAAWPRRLAVIAALPLVTVVIVHVPFKIMIEARAKTRCSGPRF